MLLAVVALCCVWSPRASAGSAPLAAGANAKISVIFFSEKNHTRTLGQAIVTGAQSVAGTTVELVDLADADVQTHVLDADAVLIGSPVHFGNMASALQLWVETKWAPYWQTGAMAGKVGGMFATGGGIAQGIEHVLASLQRTLMSFQFQVVVPDPTSSPYTSFGAMAATETPPFNVTGPGGVAQCFLDTAEMYGKLVADITVAKKQATAGGGYRGH
jgi:NAD(P)H dehydrogenase (quinone)